MFIIAYESILKAYLIRIKTREGKTFHCNRKSNSFGNARKANSYLMAWASEVGARPSPGF